MTTWRDHFFFLASTKYYGRSFLLYCVCSIAIIILMYGLFLSFVESQERGMRLGTLLPQECLYFEETKDSIEDALHASNDLQQIQRHLERLRHWHANRMAVSQKIQPFLSKAARSLDTKLLEHRVSLLKAFDSYVDNIQQMDRAEFIDNRLRLQKRLEQFDYQSFSYGDLVEMSCKVALEEVEEMRQRHFYLFLLIMTFFLSIALGIFLPAIRVLLSGLTVTSLSVEHFLPNKRTWLPQHKKSVLSEDVYRKRAYYDEISGVGNRRYLHQLINELIGQPNVSFVYVYIDLENLKSINEKFGYDMGDWCLRIFGNILKKQMCRSDYIARLGGDEFVVISQVNNVNRIEFLLDEVKTEFQASCCESTEGIIPSFCYGLALFPQDAGNVEQLFRVADKNVYFRRMLKDLHD